MRLGTLACLLAGVCAAQTASFTVVSAASYARDGALAPESIATGFSDAIPENPQLSAYSVTVQNVAASPVAIARGLISFVLPAGVPDGAATVTLRRGETAVATGAVRIARVAPAIFTANSSGEGAPAGQALYADASGGRRFEDLFERFTGSSRWEPAPLHVDAAADVYLILFGTGLRHAPAGSVRATLGGVDVPVLAAQAQGSFAGLDQVNLGPLPRSLANGRGRVDLELTAAGAAANKVTIAPAGPASGGWGVRAGLLEANSEMGVAGLDAKIYVMGGYPASRVTVPTVQVYDTVSDSWRLAAPLPIGVNHHAPAVVNGRIYVIGGQTDANTAFVNHVQEYDPATDTWRQRAPMPTARGGGAAAVVDGKIYVAGGRPPRGADFAVYDPARDQWTALPDMPTQRNHLIALAHGGKVYVFGGRFEAGFQSAAADAVEIYDTRTGQWTRGAALPKPRGGLNGAAAYGCMHIFGGEFATGVHPDHDVYDPVTNTWTSLAPMPIPVHGVTGLHFQDGLIYLPGGGTSQGGSSGSRHHQVYRPNRVCE